MNEDALELLDEDEMSLEEFPGREELLDRLHDAQIELEENELPSLAKMVAMAREILKECLDEDIQRLH